MQSITPPQLVIAGSVVAEFIFSVVFASIGRFADAYFVALIALGLLSLGIFATAVEGRARRVA